jgi:hypothetical protein
VVAPVDESQPGVPNISDCHIVLQVQCCRPFAVERPRSAAWPAPESYYALKSIRGLGLLQRMVRPPARSRRAPRSARRFDRTPTSVVYQQESR